MTLLAPPAGPLTAPAARTGVPGVLDVRTLVRTVIYLVVGGALVVLGVLLAPTSTVTTVDPAVPATTIPVMGDYDTTGGLIWNQYRDAGGSLTP